MVRKMFEIWEKQLQGSNIAPLLYYCQNHLYQSIQIQCSWMCFADRVVFSLGTFQNVSVPVNRTVQAVVSRIPADVSFITLQFHTQHNNVTLSYTQVSYLHTQHWHTRVRNTHTHTPLTQLHGGWASKTSCESLITSSDLNTHTHTPLHGFYS